MSTPQTLTVNRYPVKRSAVSDDFGHGSPVAVKRKEPKNVLHKLFLRRVQEEMEKQGLSRAGLARRAGGPSQTTFNDVMNGSDPQLETIHQISTALSVPAWSLFVESDLVRQLTPERRKIFNFPSYPRVFTDRPGKTSRLPNKKQG